MIRIHFKNTVGHFNLEFFSYEMKLFIGRNVVPVLLIYMGFYLLVYQFLLTVVYRIMTIAIEVVHVCSLFSSL